MFEWLDSYHICPRAASLFSYEYHQVVYNNKIKGQRTKIYMLMRRNLLIHLCQKGRRYIFSSKTFKS